MIPVQSAHAIQEIATPEGNIESVSLDNIAQGDLLSDPSATGFSQDLLAAVDKMADLSKQANAPISSNSISPTDMIKRQQSVEDFNLSTQMAAKVTGQAMKAVDSLTKIQ